MNIHAYSKGLNLLDLNKKAVAIWIEKILRYGLATVLFGSLAERFWMGDNTAEFYTFLCGRNFMGAQAALVKITSPLCGVHFNLK